MSQQIENLLIEMIEKNIYQRTLKFKHLKGMQSFLTDVQPFVQAKKMRTKKVSKLTLLLTLGIKSLNT